MMRSAYARFSRGSFDKRLQASGGIVPLRGNLVEVQPGFFQALGIQLPDALAAMAGVAHEARITKGIEVPRDRLTRHSRALAQTCYGERSVDRQSAKQAETCFVPQGSEHRYGVRHPESRSTAATRHASQWP